MRHFVFLALLLPASALAQGNGPLPAGGLADYQLGGAYPPPAGVGIVVRDSTDRPVPGLFNICYVNGFQTQPDRAWPEDLLLRARNGRPLADEDWPDEFLLDISTPQQRQANLARLRPTIQACADKGFDAVEFDNLDSYTRSQGRLDIEDALAFAQLLVTAATTAGLPAGQKNTAELEARGRDEAGFTFAVTEECYRWDECFTYTAVYGPTQVIAIEYQDDLRGRFTDACQDPDRPTRTILRDRMLSAAGAEDYAFEACRQ